jgi:hypothetical protein
LLWLIGLGSAIFIYAALAASRRRKQLLVDRTWRNEAPHRIRARLGLARIDVDEATACKIAGTFFDALYDGFGVRTFGALMRAMTQADYSRGQQISVQASERAAELLPEVFRVSGAALIALAIEDAGGAAQRAADQSREV